MITYTITCPPTVGTFGSTETGSTSRSETGNDGGNEASGSNTQGATFQATTNTDSVVFISFKTSGIFGGAGSINEILEDGETQSGEGTILQTISWNGEATTSITLAGSTTFYSADTVSGISNDEFVGEFSTEGFGEAFTTSTETQITESFFKTSFTTTAGQTTSTTHTTQSNLTLTSTGNVLSVTGTTFVSNSLTLPRTTITQTSSVVSSLTTVTTARLTTTTQSETITMWEVSNFGAANRGTFRTATVVLIDTNEAFYSLTKTVNGFEFMSAIASLNTEATEFTVLPIFETTEGMVFQTSDGEFDTELEIMTGTIGTESSVETSSATFRASQLGVATISVATQNLLPPLTSTRTILTVATSSGSSIHSSTIYTGDTSEISTRRTSLISAQIGNITYMEPAVYFTTEQTTHAVAFTSSGTFLETVADSDASSSFTEQREIGQSVAWEREISYYALPFVIFGNGTGVRAGGASYQQARAPLSSVSQAALRVGAVNMTVSLPNLTFLTVLGARTALAVLSTSWSYVSSPSTVRVSADARGLSATSRVGTGTNSSTTTTSGSWTTEGAPVTVALAFPIRRMNAAGRAATGGELTVTQQANIYLTSNNSTSGTTFFSDALTSIRPFTEARSAISSPLVAVTGRHLSPFASPTSLFLPYFTTQRNLTTLPTDPPGALL